MFKFIKTIFNTAIFSLLSFVIVRFMAFNSEFFLNGATMPKEALIYVPVGVAISFLVISYLNNKRFKL